MLGYRTTFAVDVERSEGIEAETAIETLLGEGFRWLRKQKDLRDIDSLEPWTEKLFSNGSRAIFGTGTTRSGDEYGKLVYFDPPQPSGQWVTTLLIARSAKKRGLRPMVSIEIDTPRDPRRDGLPMFANRPKLAKNILDGYVCLDHDIVMSDDPIWVRDEEEVGEFLRHLEDASHRGLIIACGTDGTVAEDAWWRILDDITTECAGQATVYVLDANATALANSRLSDGHLLKPYALRTFKPGADLDDPQDGLRHRALSPKALLDSSPDKLRRMIGRICRTYALDSAQDRFIRRLDLVTGAEFDRATFDEAENRVVRTLERQAEPSESDSSAHGDVVTTTASTDASSAVPSSPISEAPAGRTESADALELGRLRDGIAVLEALVAERDERVRGLEEQNDRLRLEKEAALMRSEKVEALRISEGLAHADELDALRSARDDEALEVEIQLEERAKAEKALRRAEYQLAKAREELRRAGLGGAESYEEKADPYDIEISEWNELEILGADAFPHVRLCCEWKTTLELGDHPRSLSWLRETWDILAMLDEYAAFRTSDAGREFKGGLHEYLRGGAPGGNRQISGDRLKDNESITAQNKWGSQRIFTVPKDVDPSGRRKMLAHFEIRRFKSVSPRLYFEDRTADLGQIVVGYIGPHLTNTQS